MPAEKRVLLVATPPSFFGAVGPVLQRSEIGFDRVGGSFDVLELVAAARFDLVVVGSAIREPTLAGLLDEIRTPGGPCRSSSVVVLAEAGSEAVAAEALANGANVVLPWPSDVVDVLGAFNRLLSVAPRMATRFMVKISVQVTSGWKKLFARSLNVSATGILLEVGEALDLDSEVQVEFTLPGEAEPIRCGGRVARCMAVGNGAARNVGVRFVSFEGASKERLEAVFPRG